MNRIEKNESYPCPVFREGGDWRAAETANRISVRTAHGYITVAEDHQSLLRGGATKKRVDPALVSRMVAYVEENP